MKPLIPEFKIKIERKGPKNSELYHIKHSEDAATLCRQLFDDGTIQFSEEIILVCLSQASNVIGYYKIGKGGLTGTVCDPRVIFTLVLNCPGTTAIILSHNHPSGNLKPSNADIELTKKVKDAGAMLDIRLLEHIIISEDGHFSFADEGYL